MYLVSAKTSYKAFPLNRIIISAWNRSHQVVTWDKGTGIWKERKQHENQKRVIQCSLQRFAMARTETA